MLPKASWQKQLGNSVEREESVPYITELGRRVQEQAGSNQITEEGDKSIGSEGKRMNIRVWNCLFVGLAIAAETLNVASLMVSLHGSEKQPVTTLVLYRCPSRQPQT